MKNVIPFIVIVAATTWVSSVSAQNTGGGEPPGPWEEYSAILAADCIIQGKVGAHRTVSLFNIYTNQDSERFVIELVIQEVIKDELESLEKDDIIEILIPSPLEFSGVCELPESVEIHQIPDIFKEGSEIIASLHFNTKNKWYTSFSHWGYLCFFKSTESELERIQDILNLSAITRSEAVEIAKKELGIPADELRISIGGCIIEDGSFSFSINPQDPNIIHLWIIWQMDNTKNVVFIDAQDGKTLKIYE